MKLESALATQGLCYADAGEQHFVINMDGSLFVSWELPSGKTSFDYYGEYQYAFTDYQLETFNWHVKEE